MAISPEALFTSLQAGDLLTVPFQAPNGVSGTFFIAVLRVDGSNLYFSHGCKDQPTARADARRNPLRWSHEKNTLVDCDDDVPHWYSLDITLERGAAKVAAAEYAAVPRYEDVRYKLTESDIRAFRNHPRYRTIAGIVENGEAGDPSEQLSLVLSVMGLLHTKEQMLAMTWCLIHQRTHAALDIAMMANVFAKKYGSVEDGSQSPAH